ncbi:cyclin-dependent kinase 2-interacting protein [Spodoptera litura]|uniref:Cyclin-dependent kinase 2-interacting protein n=1 Tax=Spodoptera litura TaxID=69820 RepID=A0A9J7DQD2_SPOLT|nr:cyclin-dependent kinase 2-interacting protein [Spodoptera litura]
MSKTPIKTDSNCNFIPREITTPNKDHQGVSKTVHSHVSKLHGLLNDWIKIRDKGVRLCRAISALKLHECDDDYYPSQLKQLMEGLLDALDGLKNVVDGVKILNNQLQALAKLQPSDEPVINSWPVKKISQSVMKIFESLEKEYRLKQIVTENVAHSRDEKLIEVYVSAWEFEAYFSLESFAYLFAEVGLAGVT